MVRCEMERLVRRPNPRADQFPRGGWLSSRVFDPSRFSERLQQTVRWNDGLVYKMPDDVPFFTFDDGESRTDLWLQRASDGWVDEHRIDFKGGESLIAESRLHPGRPTANMTALDAEDEWEGYRSTIPDKGLTATRQRASSPMYALRRFDEIRDQYFRQELLVGHAVQIAALLAHHHFGVSFDGALDAEAHFKRACSGKRLRVTEALAVFRSLCESWSLAPDDVEWALLIYERACRDNSIGKEKRVQGDWLLDHDAPIRLLPRPTRGPAPCMTPLEAALFAEMYVEEFDAHGPKVAAALAERRDLPVGEVQRRIRYVRENGYLIKGRQGHTGGELSARSREILSHRQEA